MSKPLAILLSGLVLAGSAAGLGFRNRSLPVNDASLMGYWSLDAADLQNTMTNIDRTGKYPMTVLGVPTLTNGMVHEGIKLGTGWTNYLDSFVKIKVTNFTICAWVKITTSIVGNGPQPRIFSDGGYGNYLGSIELAIWQDGKPYLLTQNGSGQGYRYMDKQMRTNVWEHVAVTFESTNATYGQAFLYLNATNNSGVIGSQMRNPQTNSSYNFRIGRNGGGTTAYATNCSIDEVLFFNRVLTTTEISNIYNFGH